MPTRSRYAGIAPAISFQSIFKIDLIIRNPTIIRAGAVAKPGIAMNIGAQTRETRNQSAQISEDKPVLAPALIPIADSASYRIRRREKPQR